VPSAIDNLRSVAPNWVSIKSYAQEVLEIIATPLRAGGEASRPYNLTVEAAGDLIFVREEIPGRLLPKWCPERHINQDKSFCLGLRAGEKIKDLTQAFRWWRKLELFLDCQETAHNTGRWPVYAQLSHGSAGAVEIEAEQLARSLGLLDDYQRGVQFGLGIIAIAVSHTKSGKAQRNKKAPCLCGYHGKRGKRLLRKDCGMAQSEKCLVTHELRRQRAETAFWKTFPGETCCQSMEKCPLRDAGGHAC
jgi:hypothetical protein